MSNENKLDILKPFGPSIGSTNFPKNLTEKINNFVDKIIKDENKSKELDVGRTLVGQVSQEILLPKEITEGEFHVFLMKATKVYIEYITGKKITKFDFINVWVVRQFQNEYNPTHWHGGHISGAGYLKLPDGFGASKQLEKKKT